MRVLRWGALVRVDCLDRRMKSFFRLLRHGNASQSVTQTTFSNLIRRADTLAQYGNVVGLQDLVKIVLRPIQSAHIRDAYLKTDHGALTELYWTDSLGIRGYVDGVKSDVLSYIYSQCLVPVIPGKEILDLASDIVMPTCWHPQSIVSMLGSIGPGLKCGDFTQSSNHRVSYMYPLGIGWVDGGNHSIMQAIIRGDGKIKPIEYLDVTKLVREIRYDGEGWRCIRSDRILGSPLYPEFGWVWEISRRILDQELRD